ncbi:hypothetical protein CCP3SC1AL1_450017 [Gammaproteobacteria bacterium]
MNTLLTRLFFAFPIVFTLAGLSGCSVFMVADAAVSVAAATVEVGASVVETAVDVTASGVKAVTGSGN